MNLNALQAEYLREVGSKINRDVNSLIIQARQWEQNGEFQTAVDCYVKVSGRDTIMHEHNTDTNGKLPFSFVRL